ncbi:major facilitator superfamily domain-containing protein [Stachybotrys elegans]|uniref:Major facilitator superfamily domain-containing protein n=1 Tax=Stachybotrys elegans TaxID=80388 RepID=A0A8K0WPC0_9HYPO|nr:major facilitator superfamily domain-containing protein [Stachybotrys elegans]
MEKQEEPQGTDEAVPATPEAGDYSIFTGSMRFYLTYLMGFVIILSTFTATIYFPLIPLLSREFSVSTQAINLTVTLYAACQGLTPPIFASLADSFGRRPVLIGLTALYACASLGLTINRDSYGVLLALRALQSIGGSATPAIAYGIAADVAVMSERGSMLGPMLATCNAISAIGPVIGGAVAESTGAYTWVFLSLCIIAVICLVLVGFTLPETSRAVVGDGSGRSPVLSRMWGTERLITKYGTSIPNDSDPMQRPVIPRDAWRPMMLLEPLRIIFYPDTAAVLWMIATSYCVYYTYQVAIPVIFADIYGYNNLEIGLAFLPGLAGLTIGGMIAGKLLDRNFAIVARKHNFPIDRKKAQEIGEFPLEGARYRHILPFVALEVALVAGYGWAVQHKAHAAVLLVMQFFICTFSTLLSHTSSALLVDMFPNKSSTSYAAGQLMRCGLSAASAAVLEPLGDAVGRGWYFTIFAIFTALGSVLCVYLTTTKGKTWRQNRQR